MKRYRKIKLILLILITIGSSYSFAQSKTNIGAYVGGGVINGNLPSQGSFTSNIFFEFDPGISNDLYFRLSFLYITDINRILPGSTYDYFPFIQGFSIKAITYQKSQGIFYFEEGLGPVILNDRTYINLNEWDYGLTFSVLAGIDLTNENMNGIKLGVGTEYGLGITNTNVRFLSLHLQIQYLF